MLVNMWRAGGRVMNRPPPASAIGSSGLPVISESAATCVESARHLRRMNRQSHSWASS